MGEAVKIVKPYQEIYKARMMMRGLMTPNDEKRIRPKSVSYARWLGFALENDAAADSLVRHFGPNVRAMRRLPLCVTAALTGIGDASALKLLAWNMVENWDQIEDDDVLIRDDGQWTLTLD
jgi:hypothetical protein